jgi:4-hydroxy-2-oxoheptanedioate aldolase
MRENKVRSIWAAGGAVLNGWLHIPSGFAAEAMAHQGWDSLTIDMQHGPVDYQDSLAILQAISTTNTTPMARVPWNEPGMIMKMLDAGCYGIICPMVNNRAEAEAFVGACRYPPQGYRSYGPTRVSLYAGADYAPHANETVITMAMIETGEAMNNLDEIMSVPGLDAIYVGPADLSQGLGGGPGIDWTEPRMVEAIDKVLATAKKHGVVAGIHTGSTGYASQMIEKGFQFVTVLSDVRLMTLAAEQVIIAVKGGQEQKVTGPY